ncbi:hypothetical protein [Methylomonas sp. CM2]|uniref:hypothetical protein n=1 Tax=Methylomonas sp. CM2 TaxID=3417647 RepID=UPI003CF8FD92
MLSKPAERPIQIAADSIDEALAYLSQLLSEHGDEALASYRDRVLVFDKAGCFPKLAMGAESFIAVAYKQEVIREFAAYSKTLHTFAIFPRNLISEPDIVLEPVNSLVFSKALEEMGMDKDNVARYAIESGRSLTVLRRRLSENTAVRTPEWAEKPETAKQLIPFMLVGTWDSRNENDKRILSKLAGDRPYDELEQEFQILTQLDDAPVWSIDSIRGVISKIDLIYAIKGVVTSADLSRYFEVARLVLGEDDPSLDLEESKRWIANIYGKTRVFSSILRKSISETLVLLSVNASLFNKRLGFDAEMEAAKVVRDLMSTPLTARTLEANNYDLSTYAEAAPDTFLSILESDLKSGKPAALELMRPVASGIFGNTPSRSGLLWALESLAWNPETLLRTTRILARLAQIQINDNWSNKPINSLKSIYRSWMPQTAANHQQRFGCIRKLVKEFQDIAWELCLDQFGQFYGTGEYTQKPRWRHDGYGFGEPLSNTNEINAFVKDIVEMALTWQNYSLEMLRELVTRLYGLSPQDQDRAWELIVKWAKTKATDDEKAALREHIRVSTLSRTAAMRAKRMGHTVGLTSNGSAAYQALEPRDILNKHAWLFRETWVAESADEIEEIDDLDIVKRNMRINKLRSDALRQILAERGIDGILTLAARGKADLVIGDILVTQAIVSEQSLLEIIQLAFQKITNAKHDSVSAKNLIRGALHAISDEHTREALICAFMTNHGEKEAIQLFLLAPFCHSTWKMIDKLSETSIPQYWAEVTPQNISNNEMEAREAVERLLKAERPRAAFWYIQYHPEQLETITLFKLLTKITQGGKDKSGEYMLDEYRLEEAFKLLNNCSELTIEQKASLEFYYIDALGKPIGLRSGYGIPNLERYIQEHPEFFAHAVAFIYKRKDEKPDPAELQIPADQVTAMAERCYKLLEAIERIPGRNEFDELNTNYLAKWIATVRQLGRELGRADITDDWIGRLLSQAPLGKDDVWPCEQVREVLEEIQSIPMIEGMRVGVYNARGAHWRAEGGSQERVLAEKYHKWGNALRVSHQFVATSLLFALAKDYERDANREDTEADINRRIS